MMEFDAAETFVFKLLRDDGDEIVFVKKTFPDGATIDDMAEMFRDFLRAVTYSDETIDKILVEEEW